MKSSLTLAPRQFKSPLALLAEFTRSATKRIADVVRLVERTQGRQWRQNPHSVADDLRIPRRAKTVGATTGTSVLCKLLDKEAAVVGEVITVNLFKTSTDSFPIISSGDIIPVFKDLNAEWYACFVMIPYTTCAD